MSGGEHHLSELGGLEKFAPSLNARYYEAKLMALKSYAKKRSQQSVSLFSSPGGGKLQLFTNQHLSAR